MSERTYQHLGEMTEETFSSNKCYLRIVGEVGNSDCFILLYHAYVLGSLW